MDNFEDALTGAIGIEQRVKDLIAAAEQGDLNGYQTIIKQLNFGTISRDYAMILIILSPIVAVIRAAEKHASDSSTDHKIAELESKVGIILKKDKFKKLCTDIGNGDGRLIWSNLDSFKNYKDLLKLLSSNKYGVGGTSDLFMLRAARITPWTRVNKAFITTHLIPFVRDTLGTKFSSSFSQGLRQAPGAPAAAAITTTTTTTSSSSAPKNTERMYREVYASSIPMTDKDHTKFKTMVSRDEPTLSIRFWTLGREKYPPHIIVGLAEYKNGWTNPDPLCVHHVEYPYNNFVDILHDENKLPSNIKAVDEWQFRGISNYRQFIISYTLNSWDDIKTVIDAITQLANNDNNLPDTVITNNIF